MARQRKLPDGMRLRGKVYYAWFQRDGRRVRNRLSTDYRVACELLEDLKGRAARAEFGNVDNNYLWLDLKKEFLDWARQRTRCGHEYRRDLEWFEDYRPIRKVDQISETYLVGFAEWRLAQGVSPRTVNKNIATLRHMLNKGVKWGRIGANPIAGVRPLKHDRKRKERRSLTPDEVQTLFDASPDYLRPVWRMLLTTGLRRDELVNMRFDDIDFERRTAAVRAATAKNHRRREVPLDDTMLAVIRDLKDRAKDRQSVKGWNAKLTRQQHEHFSRDHVFVTKVNTPWRNNLLTRFYAVCRRAGIQDAHPGGAVDIHSLRVTFTTLALEWGANPKAVQTILGHSTLNLTMGIYARATNQAQRRAVDVLPFTSPNPGRITEQKWHRSGTKNIDEKTVDASCVVVSG